MRNTQGDFPRFLHHRGCEGHCDLRGSAEYNLGLGDRRSTVAATSLFSSAYRPTG